MAWIVRIPEAAKNWIHIVSMVQSEYCVFFYIIDYSNRSIPRLVHLGNFALVANFSGLILKNLVFSSYKCEGLFVRNSQCRYLSEFLSRHDH